MAVREFTGTLDDEPKITPFDGELDAVPGMAPAKPAPSTKDKFYQATNRLFGRGSVMDGMDAADAQTLHEDQAGQYLPKRATQADIIASKIFQEQAGKMRPTIGTSKTRMVDGAAGVAEVAARRGVGGLIESLGGATRAAGDALDIEALARGGSNLSESGNRFAQGAQLRNSIIPGFGPGSVVHDLPEAGANAGASIIQTAPALAANVLVPGSGLPALFAQTGAQQYSQGRDAGLNPAGAGLRAIPQAAAEVLGEKLGGFNVLSAGIRKAATDNSLEPLARALIQSAGREMPGEQFTTAAQFLTDKAPGIGINQEAGLSDYTKAAKDTALATLLQSGAMGGAGVALDSIARRSGIAPPPGTVPPRPARPEKPKDVSQLSNAIAGTAKIQSANVTEVPDDFPLDPPGTPAIQPADAAQNPPAGAPEKQGKNIENILPENIAPKTSRNEAAPEDTGKNIENILPENEQGNAGRIATGPGDTTGLKGMGAGMADAISHNLYAGLYASLEQGKDTMAGIKDPVLARAKPYFDAGLIKTPQDIRDFESSGYPALPNQAKPHPAPVPDPGASPDLLPQQQERPKRDYQYPAALANNAMQIDAPTEGFRPGDIVNADGNPFTTKARAAVVKKRAGRGWAMKRAKGGFVVRYQPQSAGQIEALNDRIRNQERVDPEKDSMFTAIAKMGGINSADVKSSWDMSTDLEGLRGHGIKRVATQNGYSIDAMGEMLAEHGYLSVDEHGKYDPHEFEDLFGGELAGHQHYTPEGFAAQGEQANANAYEDYLSEQDIKDSGFDELPEGMQNLLEEFLRDNPVQETEDEAETRLEREAIQAESREYEARQRSENQVGKVARRPGQERSDAGNQDGGNRNASEAIAGQKAERDPAERAPDATESQLNAEPKPAPIVQAEKPALHPEPGTPPKNDAPERAPRAERAPDNAIAQDQPEDAAAEPDEPLALTASESEQDKAPRQKIEDFGEVLKGARKEYGAAYQDKMGESEDLDIAVAPLSKTWPEPEYQKLLDNGVDPWTVAFVRAGRDEIPTKPIKSYKQARWVEQVKTLRGMAYRLLDGSITAETVQNALTKPEFARLQEEMLGRVDLYQAVGHGKSLKGISLVNHSFGMYRGQKYSPSKTFWIVEKQPKSTAFGNWPRELATGVTREEALDAFKKMYDSLDTTKPTNKDIEFVIYSRFNKPGFYVGKKTGKNYIDLKFFNTSPEARTYKENNHAELVALLEKKKEIPNERRDSNLPRIGADHRGGTNVSPEAFSETFGFRGVQFGNYVEGQRRQEDLNNAYDGLMDMAGMLGISPKAISLNGQLGLAFGARGKGGKGAGAAHYEGGEVVINLTKGQGAGSLAHEWWHALDNYFSRARGAKGEYMTEALDVSLAARGSDYLKRDNGVRPEMVAAYGEVLKAVKTTGISERSKNLDSRRSKDYWSTKVEMTARAFESYVINRLQDQGQSNDYLANIVSEQDYRIEEGYPYPTAAEVPVIRAAYDHFFNTIQTKETESGVALFSAQSTSGEGASAEEVRAAIAADTYGHEVDVYASMEDAPDYVQAQAKKEGVIPEGFFDRRTGRVAIIADQVTPERAVEVARHELIGHYGLESMVGQDEMKRLTARVIKAEAEGNKTIADLAKHVDATQPGLSPERRAKEIMAVMAERNLQNQIARRVIDAIRKFLKSIGFTKGDITDAQIAGLLRDAQAYLREQGRAMVAGEPAADFSTVWHGTQHIWPPERGFPHGRPRLDKMGSGEGAQAFGWGFYTAENPGVASSYRKNLATTTRAHMAFDGQKLTPKLLKELQENPDKDIAGFFKDELPPRFHGTTKKVLPWMEERIADAKAQEARFIKRAEDSERANDVVYATHSAAEHRKSAAYYADRVRRLEKIKAMYAAMPDRLNGAIYKLDIPDAALPRLLDWDKKISEQTPEVQAALNKLSDPVMDAWKTNGAWAHVKGETLYRHLASGNTKGATEAGKAKAASEQLATLGIVGNRYYDGFSRSKGEGSYNFVIWHQPTLDKVAMMKRNGEALDAMREAEFSAGLFDQPTALEAGKPLSRAEVLAKQAKEEQAAKEAAKPVKETGKQLKGEQVDMFNPQSSLFSAKQPGDQSKLKLDVDPITGKDFVSTERDTAGRRRWVAGRKAYDAIARNAVDILGKVKLADDAPPEFKAMMRAYRVDQTKAQANAEQVAKIGMAQLTAAERKMLSDVIEGNVAPGDIPPQTVLKIATEIQAALKQQGEDLVELGMIDESRLIQHYLPRAYRNPLLARLTSKEIFKSWYQKARLKIGGSRLKSRGLVHEIRPGEWSKYQKLGWKLSSMSDGSEIPDDLRLAIRGKTEMPPQYPKDLKFLVWRDFTQDEREKMGEIHDGLLRYALGYVETQRDIAVGRLFKKIASNQALSSTINPGGWAKVPDELIVGADGIKRYGALSGRYVPEMVRDMIERSTQDKGPLMAVYDKALNFWKEGKTVWNPVAHGNNIISNVFTAHFSGLNVADPRVWRGTVKQYRTKGEYYQEAVEHGLFGTEWASKDIQEMFLPDLIGDLDVETISASRFNKVVNALKKTGKPVGVYRDVMQKAYEFEDQFFKLMLFIDRRKAGASIEDAINDTERYIFNYSDVPEGVELLKRTYSPFISYTYKALPMLVHTAMTRPDRLLAPILLLGGGNWLAYALMGADEEEERKNMPEYLKGRTAIGTPKTVRVPFNVEGRPAYMDMTRRVPLGDLFDMNNQTGGIAAPAPIMPSHPLFTASAALFFNVDTFTGKDLTKVSDTDWEAAQKRADWIFKQIVPNAPFIPGSWNFDKLMNGAANAFDTEMAGYTGYTKAGDATPFALALLDVAGGTKIRSFDPARNKDFKEYEIDKERKELLSNIRSATRNQAMAPGKRESYIAAQRDKMNELTRKRQELN